MNLIDKKIVITGANGALGRAVVEQALALQASPILIDLAFDQDWVGQFDGKVDVHCADLLDETAVSELFEKITVVDGLVNVAGGFDMGPTVHETSSEQWQKMFALNVSTLRHVVNAAMPKLLQAQGAVVNIGAAAATQGVANMSAYTASKSTVMRLTEAMSAECKQQGVNVNAVLPSVIDTAANRAAMPDADFSDWVTPQQLANVITFLLSDSANGVHGALIPVRGLS